MTNALAEALTSANAAGGGQSQAAAEAVAQALSAGGNQGAAFANALAQAVSQGGCGSVGNVLARELPCCYGVQLLWMRLGSIACLRSVLQPSLATPLELGECSSVPARSQNVRTNAEAQAAASARAGGAAVAQALAQAQAQGTSAANCVSRDARGATATRLACLPARVRLLALQRACGQH